MLAIAKIADQFGSRWRPIDGTFHAATHVRGLRAARSHGHIDRRLPPTMLSSHGLAAVAVRNGCRCRTAGVT
jgi:hypothetical protein